MASGHRPSRNRKVKALSPIRPYDDFVWAPFFMAYRAPSAARVPFNGALYLDERSPPDEERNGRKDQEHDEEDFRDACSSRGESSETENRGNDRDDEKHSSPVQHGRVFLS